MFEDTKKPNEDKLPHIVNDELKELFYYGFKSAKEDKHSHLRRAIVQMRESEVEDPPHLTGFYLLLFGYESKYTK